MNNNNQQTNTTTNMLKAYNDYNVLKIRLDTQPLLDQIELFLRGCRLIVKQNEETGRIKTERVKMGIAKCNDDGIQSLLNWVSATINPQTVQGNFPVDKNGFSKQYENYIYEYNVELATLIVTNCYNWQMIDEEIDGVIEFIMLLIIPFMSRLIGNEERKSFGESMKMVESNTMASKGNIPIFNS